MIHPYALKRRCVVTFCLNSRGQETAIEAHRWGHGVWLFALLCGVVHPNAAFADATYDDEYTRRLKITQTIEPVGDSPFGEQINLRSGEVSFRQVDVTLEGIGPGIALERTLRRNDAGGSFPGELGDWALAVPQIQTIVPAAAGPNATAGLWRVGEGYAGGSENRCSQFDYMWSPPPGYYGPKSGGFLTEEWWRGYTLEIPNAGSQELLLQNASNTLRPASGAYPAVTSRHWQVSCLPTTSNQEPGEAFLVLAPDGTKYYMDRLDYAPYETYREYDSAAGVWFRQPRMLARMRASRVVDRFGNQVNYGYQGNRLTSISAADGRTISIVWRNDVALVDRVVADGRTWTFTYVDPAALTPVLKTVSRPDGSTWEYSNLLAPRLEPVSLGGCFPGAAPSTQSSSGIDRIATVKHPSGLLGTFRYSKRLHAQSYVPSACTNEPRSESENPYFLTTALVERQLSGPGVPTATWRYTYEIAHASVLRDCAGDMCQGTTYTDVTAPDGKVTRYTHSTRYDALDGKLERIDYGLSGGVAARSETFGYALLPGSSPYPGALGSSMANGNIFAAENDVPLTKKVTIQDGVQFTWRVPSDCGTGSSQCLDPFGRPTKVEKSSTPAP